MTTQDSKKEAFGFIQLLMKIKRFFKRMLFVYWAGFFLILLSQFLTAQTGPGGVGNTITNKLWLRADKGITQSFSYLGWSDVSGNGHFFSQSIAAYVPSYETGVLNNQPAVRFNGINQFLSRTQSPALNVNPFTVIIVANPKGLTGSDMIPFASYDSVMGSGYFFNATAGNIWKFNTGAFGTYSVYEGGPLAVNSPKILSGYADQFFVNGVLGTGSFGGNVATNNTMPMFIGKGNMAGYFNGDLHEIIYYDIALNPLQRHFVENYLSSKYAIPIINDFYSYDIAHPFDVAGIGQSGGNNVNLAYSTILGMKSTSFNGSPQYILFGHNGQSATGSTTGTWPNGVVRKLNRTWRVDMTQSQPIDTIFFNLNNLFIGDPSALRLLISDEGTFTSGATFTYSGLLIGDRIAFPLIGLDAGRFITLGSTSLANFTPVLVTNTNPDGPGSLASAIQFTNSNPGPDTIKFAIPDNSVIQTTGTLFITDGYTYVDADMDQDGIPDIEINGNGGIFSGISINSSNNTIKGFAITGFYSSFGGGIALNDTFSQNNKIEGNYIGLNLNGEVSQRNYNGVYIFQAKNNLIGGYDLSKRNVISGNQNNGIYIGSAVQNIVAGNFIGLHPGGIMARPNLGYGIAIEGSSHNQIGSDISGGGNIISGNLGYGIWLSSSSHHNSILSNMIGCSADGGSLGNGNSNIKISYSNYNIIGGSSGNIGNVISNSAYHGIEIENSLGTRILGNKIGVNVSGNLDMGNAVDGIYMADGCDSTAIGDGTESGKNIISGNGGNAIFADGMESGVAYCLITGNHIGVGADTNIILGNDSCGIRFFTGGEAVQNNKLEGNRIAHNGPNGGVLFMGASVLNNTLFQNSIYNNQSTGLIYLNGAQGNIQPPVITSVADHLVTGTCDANALVQIYADDGNQGRYYLDTVRAVGTSWQYTADPGLINVNITAMQTVGLNTSVFSIPNGGLFDYLNVTKISDDGTAGTLRGAIQYANSNPGADTIRFTLPPRSEIRIYTELPDLTDSATVINGDMNGDYIPDIVLNGDYAPQDIRGFGIFSAHNVLKGLVIHGFRSTGAVVIAGADAYDNKVIGNYIGTDSTGTIAYTNENGVSIYSGAHDNFIGLPNPGEGNVISGSSSNGIYIFNNCRNIHIINNFIGTDFTGQQPVGNANMGIYVYESDSIYIGVAGSNGRNIISGNSGAGVLLYDNYGSWVLNNYIGTGINGTETELGNGGQGLALLNCLQTVIGSGETGGGNLIAGNNEHGLVISFSSNNLIYGNRIGTNAAGMNALPNIGDGIQIGDGCHNNIVGINTGDGRNVISGNGGAGIYMKANTVSSFHNPIIGNYIGVGSDGTTPLGNNSIGISVACSVATITADTIMDNIIAFNNSEGIGFYDQAAGNFVYRNSIHSHLHGGIAGAQNGVQPPLIDSVRGTTVYGHGASNAHIQVFADDNDEGRIFLGETSTDNFGIWSLGGVTFPYNKYLTALQTVSHSTSEFSLPFDGLIDYLLVTKTADDGSAGTLRRAIVYANENPGADTITFIPLPGAIMISAQLTTIEQDSLVIDGDINDDGVPDIEIKGQNQISGLVITSANNHIHGLIINGFGNSPVNGGIVITGDGARSNLVTGCYLGVDSSGTTAYGNYCGIIIRAGASENMIGTADTNGRNIISGNTFGIRVDDSLSVNNRIVGNYVGTDKDGMNPVRNMFGISLSYTMHTSVGDGTVSGRNLVSGNDWGLYLSNSRHINISGNIFGLKADGMSRMEAEQYMGIALYASDYNQIGNGTLEGRNISSGHYESGIWLAHSNYNKVTGNLVGLDITGMNVVKNWDEGVAIAGGGMYNQIGDTTEFGRNAIAGSYSNISMQSLSSKKKTNLPLLQENGRELTFEILYNKVIGNYIGTDVTGQNIFPAIINDQNGIVLDNTDYNSTNCKSIGNQIGGPTLNYGNIIAGCYDGILLIVTDSNVVSNNWVGTNKSLTTDLGNAGSGMVIKDANPYKAEKSESAEGGSTYNHIANNVFAFNDSNGLLAMDNHTRNNNFSVNRFYDNGYPVRIQDGAQYSVGVPTVDSLDISNMLYGTGIPFAEIHVYSDSSSASKGRLHVVSTTAGASGNWTVYVPFQAGRYYSAIQDTSNNSSEFSNAYLPPQIGVLIADKTLLSFGDVFAGGMSGDEIKLTAQISPVLIDSIRLKTGAHYTVTPSQSIPFTIGLTDTLVLDALFSPAGFGNFIDTIFIYNNTDVSPVAISLSGTGIAGTLIASADDVNYGARRIGDSAEATIVFRAETGMVQISQIAQSAGGTDGFTVLNAPSLPVILHAGTDSLPLLVRFKPITGGTKSDTLKIFNNSAAQEYWVTLQGFGQINNVPNIFALKSVGTNNLTNDRTPDFFWEGKGDPDGDALTYVLEVSKTSDFATLAYRDTTADTTLTSKTLLDSVGAYFWRVTAYDGWDGLRTSNTGSFRIDAVPASLTAGTFFSGVLKQYISVNVISSKMMQSLNASIGLRSAANTLVDSTTKALDLESAANRFYQTPYKLTSAGRLFMTITGSDSAQNITTVSKNYNISTLAKDQALAINSGNWQITAPKRTFDDDGFLMVSELNHEKTTLKEKSLMTMAKAADGWTKVNDGLNIQGSAPIRSGQGFTVTITYDPDVISELQSCYADYDERKIGLYTDQNGEWVYTGGEGKNGQVQAKVKQYGMVKLMYNPDHEFLPVKVELAQNYPNPFNPTTTIRFGIPQEGKVKLTVYNVLGQKVKELVNDSRSAGYYNVIWNGRSDRGSVVSSGVYLYRLETPNGVVSKKMVLVK